MKTKCSMRFCEKVLLKIQENSPSHENYIDFDDLCALFPGVGRDRIELAILYLESMDCINLDRYYLADGTAEDYSIELNPQGRTYFMLKHNHLHELWINRILSYIAGILSPVIVYLITEYLLPLIGL